MSGVRLECGSCAVRSWSLEDVASLVRHANSREVWKNLRDRFPHPYTESHAREFLTRALEARPEVNFAIEVEGEAAGGIGLVLGTDVERCGAELGYWLGETFWGRGIATAAVREFTPFALRRFQLSRIFAVPFLPNAASCRVLEKTGYVREGILRRSAVKDGVLLDQALYAYVTGDR